MTARPFAYVERGQTRDDILMMFRDGLRQLANPETGTAFSEDEIAEATQAGSRWWIEAEAIDLVVAQPSQARALWLADQIQVERACTAWLNGYHGPSRGMTRLPASPGSGPATDTAAEGTIYLGSTTPGAAGALVARDPAGLRYQVMTTVVTPSGGVASLTLFGLDTGDATNIQSGTKLTWESPPFGSTRVLAATEDFVGGFPAENDRDFADRMASEDRHRAGAGNRAQIRAWARAASNAVADAYVYPCAMHSGTCVVAIAQKRGSTSRTSAGMVPSALVLSTVSAYLVPPGSPSMPDFALVVVVPFLQVATHAGLELRMARASDGGWADLRPWPGLASTPTSSMPAITTRTSDTQFTMRSQVGLPGSASILTGANAPRLMTWDPTACGFVELPTLTSVTDAGSGLYTVVLSSPASATQTQAGLYVSPWTERNAEIADAILGYWDSLGPGEIVGSTDARFDRACRFPPPEEESPYRAGHGMVSSVCDALGLDNASAELGWISATAPAAPSEPTQGPRKLVWGNFGVYDVTD